MTLSRHMSVIEAIISLATRHALAVVTQIIVFPWFGLYPRLGENLALGGIFTTIPLVRSYAVRRLFEAIGARKGETALHHTADGCMRAALPG
jgi:hypothetical protein